MADEAATGDFEVEGLLPVTRVTGAGCFITGKGGGETIFIFLLTEDPFVGFGFSTPQDPFLGLESFPMVNPQDVNWIQNRLLVLALKIQLATFLTKDVDWIQD